MAIPQKSSLRTNSVVDYPSELPSLDPAFLQKFPELRKWKKELDRWWFDFRTVLQRQAEAVSQDNIGTEFDTFKSSAESSLASLLSQINSLNTQITALANKKQPEQTTGVSEADFLAHVTETTTHGVTGNIVGTTDKQSLNDKRIGETTPSYGRFRGLINANTIGMLEVLIIPEGYNMVVAGALDVSGVLGVSGTLLVI